MAKEYKLSYTAAEINEKLGKIGEPIAVDTTLSVEGQAADAKAVGEAIAQFSEKQDAITGTAGQFVVIGVDGKPTAMTIPIAEEASF